MFPIKTNLDVPGFWYETDWNCPFSVSDINYSHGKKKLQPLSVVRFFEQLWSDVYITVIVSTHCELFFFRVEWLYSTNL